MSGFGPISSALFWFPVGCPIMLSSIFKMCLVSLTCLSMLIRAWNRALFNDLLYYFISTLHALFLLFTLCFRCPFMRRVLDCAHDPPSILSKLSHKNSFSIETKSHACGYLQLTTLPTFHTHQSPPIPTFHIHWTWSSQHPHPGLIHTWFHLHGLQQCMRVTPGG